MFENIHWTIIYSAVIYLFIVIGLRILGKKELGQLSIADLVFIMLISEVVGDVMRASNDSLVGGLFGALTLMLMNKVIEWLKYKFPKINKLMEGNPVILIRHGKVNKKEMIKNKISMADLEQVLRENETGDISSVALAILEVDGKISILKDDSVVSSIPFDE